MSFAETLVFVAAGSPATLPVRSGCTRLVLSEDRELQPHPVLPSGCRCRAETPHCHSEAARCHRQQSRCVARTAALI